MTGKTGAQKDRACGGLGEGSSPPGALTGGRCPSPRFLWNILGSTCNSGSHLGGLLSVAGSRTPPAPRPLLQGLGWRGLGLVGVLACLRCASSSGTVWPRLHLWSLAHPRAGDARQGCSRLQGAKAGKKGRPGASSALSTGVHPGCGGEQGRGGSFQYLLKQHFGASEGESQG